MNATNPLEIWKPVIDFEGKYEVSSLGRIRRISKSRRAAPYRLRKAKLINSGYQVVSLYSHNQGTQCLVHRLVAAAFIGPCPDGYEVNHKNLIKTDNRAENLEYVTRSANLLHRAKTGIGRGVANGASKLTEDQVREIRRRYRRGGGPGYKALGKEYGVRWEAIRNIIKRGNWAWLEEPNRPAR